MLHGKKVAKAAPRVINAGTKRIELPENAVQKSGFEHADAEFLLSVFPRDYKKIKVKGRK